MRDSAWDGLVPLSCTLITLPLATAFALPSFCSTETSPPRNQPPLRGVQSAETKSNAQHTSSSHRAGAQRASSVNLNSSGAMEQPSSGRPSSSTELPLQIQSHTQPSPVRAAVSAGQPQLSSGAPPIQPTTSQSQQQQSDVMGGYRSSAGQAMPTSSFQSGGHSLHMQHMMAAAAYHNMQQQLGPGGMQHMIPPYQQQGPSMSYTGSGYPPYNLGPYGPLADYAAQQQMYRHLTGSQSTMHSHPSTHDTQDDDDAGARAIKRPRLVWTPQLHKRFEEAIAKLGDSKAVPKNIMQEMNVEGLTRENVASHLQKYRLQNKTLGSGNADAQQTLSVSE